MMTYEVHRIERRRRELLFTATLPDDAVLVWPSFAEFGVGRFTATIRRGRRILRRTATVRRMVGDELRTRSWTVR